MRKVANNPHTFRLQDLPASKLPSCPGDSAPRSARFGGLEFYATTAEERQSLFYGKEN